MLLLVHVRRRRMWYIYKKSIGGGDLHIVKHSEQTVNHNTTLPRKVDKTRQIYKHERALFSALFWARRAVLHDEERRCGVHCAPPSRLVGSQTNRQFVDFWVETERRVGAAPARW